VIEVWRPQAVQIHRCRRVSPPASRAPQHGQTNPSGQRDANSYSRHASSVPKRCWNSKIVNGKSGRGTPRTYDTTRMELTRYALLAYLRTLAEQTATTFAYPATSAEASAEIQRLKTIPRSRAGDAQRDRRAVQRDLTNRPDDATAIRDRDVRGYGSSARWAHHPTDSEQPS